MASVTFLSTSQRQDRAQARDRPSILSRSALDVTPERMLSSMQGLEAAIHEVGRSLSAAYPPAIRHPSRTVDQRMMQMVADRPDVQAALFRFVDATPACRTPEELTEHLTALLEEV